MSLSRNRDLPSEPAMSDRRKAMMRFVPASVRPNAGKTVGSKMFLRIRVFWGLPIVLGLMLSGTAYGLDPDRRLTQYVHRIWQSQQGLPQAAIISAIHQDTDGYLWLGTQAGLVRFDGVRFTPFENFYSGAPNLWVRHVIEDSKHAIWIGTNDTGVIRLGNGKATRFMSDENSPSETVQCLISDRKGDVWACSANGLVRFSQGVQYVYGVAQGLASNSALSACEDLDGTIWVGGENSHLSVWNGSRFQTHPLISIPADSAVRSLACSDGSIWIGTTNGLVEIRDGHEKLFTVNNGLADNRVLCLARGRHGTLWIGTQSGFSRMRNGDLESFLPQDGLSQSMVYSIFEDREGSLWVGTKHGLNQFSDSRAFPYTVGEGLPSNDTGPVVQDDRGSIWAGTIGNGLARFYGRRFKAVSEFLASDSINALSPGQNNELWVGSDNGLSRLHDGQLQQTYSTRNGLPSNTIRCIFRDHTGIVWVGTSAGVAEFNRGMFVQPLVLRSLTDPILAMGEDRDGRIFFATKRGVHSLQHGQLTELTQRGTPLRDVDSFYLDPDGLVWMGTLGNGLRMLEARNVFSFSYKDGLFDDETYGIVRDNRDRLWVACSKGVFWVPRSDLRRFASGAIQKFASNSYSPTDALRLIEAKRGVQPGISVMRDGRIWFSTIRGLIVLDPQIAFFPVPPPPVVIEEVTVNGESKSPEQIGKLAPSQKNLEFRYTGLSFIAPDRMKFRYMLEGYDHDWIEAGARREAFYTNLPPGNFRFRVTACNGDGNCNETGKVIAFTLMPHYYQRAWFLPMCALSLALMGWLAYRYRIRRLREQFNLILTERSRIARELHDTLIQGFSGIALQMQALALDLPTPELRSKIDGIIHDAGDCLRETRRSVAGLRSARQGGTAAGLSAALEQAARQITETKDIRLKLKLGGGPKNLPADVEYNLLRIAMEAMSNSVKHSGARTVEVALNCSAEQVRLSIKDDGSGNVREGNGTTRLGHYGLIGMKERAAQIGADLKFVSEPGRGTIVSVLLPAGREGYPVKHE